ncbi:MAG: putative toxin-antitoxin system toxin component, PIN family [Candidatus Omnitrophota bacterium]|nr:MAG: putative toxin-antitoxin system toxin component, PIN family [Candidatus Omnitrophota bacterium]
MKNLKVIIDTNIFVSALLGGKTCKFICDHFEQNVFTLVLSRLIIKEIKETLIHKEIGHISTDDVEHLFRTINTHAKIVTPSKKVSVCRDPEDNKLLEAALAAKAHFLITGDKDLITLKTFHKTRIITPKEFLKILTK